MRRFTYQTRNAMILLLAMGLLSVPARALASGFGGYFEYLNANGKIDFDDFGLGDEDYESNKFGVGFALDTNLAQDRLFNYRLTVGYQRTDRDWDSGGDGDADGLSINNTFGFGIWRDPSFRLWAGPSLRLGVDVFDTDDDDITVVDINGGPGVSLGLNFHPLESLTLGFTAGYQYMFIGEIVNVDNDFVDETETLYGNEHLVTLNFTIFFRTGGDQF